MKMPDRIETIMFAPCGINCAVCYKHVFMPKRGKPCVGCLNGDEGKSARCLSCAIKGCAQEKGLVHCFACGDFPCARIKSMERSYQKRYDTSLIANSRRVLEAGIEAFLAEDRIRWTCIYCGGAFSLHDGVCSECGRGHEV